MRVRRIDKNGDWTFGRGRNSYASTGESVAQRVKTRLQSFKGDWFLDLDHGLPWFARFEKPADLALLEGDIKRCILETPGVDSLLVFSIDLDPETRKCRIAATVKDIYGYDASVSVIR